MLQLATERLLNVALPLFIAPFLIFTALAFLKKGKAALVWSSDLTESVRVNTALMLINSALAPVIALSLGPLQAILDSGGVWRLDPAVWQALPAWLVVVLAVMMADFSDYWVHRLMHTKWLWPAHLVHHSDTVMNNTTSVRMHVFE
ncbi:MAG: sterol desaturase family protein, partial [Hyphomonas sp.]|nr:sterol desaturase family protein [Hyphomonas sp.]